MKMTREKRQELKKKKAMALQHNRNRMMRTEDVSTVADNLHPVVKTGLVHFGHLEYERYRCIDCADMQSGECEGKNLSGEMCVLCMQSKIVLFE